MFKPSRILAFALTIVVCSSLAHARQFQSSDVEAPDHPAVRSVAYMGELMRQRSAGRLWISDVGASDQNSEIFTVAQLRTGTLDMARFSVTALHGSVPVTVVPTLPFLFASVAHRRRILDGPVGAELLASLEAYDLVGLCFYDAGSRSIYMPTRAVRTPADMKGLRIRVQTSPVMAEVMQALGAIPVPVPYGQVRARLAGGTVDAAENNIISYLGLPPSRGRQGLQPDRACRTARRRGVLQAGVGPAAGRGPRDHPPGRAGIGALFPQDRSTSRRPPREARWQARACSS